MMKLFTAFALLAGTAGVVDGAPPQPFPLDTYPSEVFNQIRKQAEDEKAALGKLPDPRTQYILTQRRWPPGSRLLVAFHGGSPQLHRDIAAVASKWSAKANVMFDFGYNKNTGQYRSWSPSDTARASHIRIGFGQPGYWSAIGTDSMVDGPFSAGKASMNFQGFPQAWPNLKPYKWEAVVLHEFGHALGFRHDHQRQVCAKEIRWVRGTDPQTQPSIYDVMKHEQGWDTAMVDANYRPVESAMTDFQSEQPNVKSCMFYPTSARALLRGTDSVCYLATPNSELSEEDIRGVRLAYPDIPSEELPGRIRVPTSNELLASARSPLTAGEQSAVRERASATAAAARPLLYIQYHGAADKQFAQQIAEAGKAAGFFAPGVEDTSTKVKKPLKVAEIRYFRPQDEDAARQASSLVTASTGSEVRLRYIEKFGKRVTRNMVELWLPPQGQPVAGANGAP